MYRLTPRMEQTFRRGLEEFHKLFSASRCSGWQLEELIFRAIQSDNQAQHHAFWKETGHDPDADITVRVNGDYHYLQIKSGKRAKDRLTLSGNRHTRFDGDIIKITDSLNLRDFQMLSVPYRQLNNKQGRQHVYRFAYIDSSVLRGLRADGWNQQGSKWCQTNGKGVDFELVPKMSWQVWWKVPISLVELGDEMII